MVYRFSIIILLIFTGELAMGVFLLVIAFVLSGCAATAVAPQSIKKENSATVYRLTVNGNNKTPLRSLYKQALLEANGICKVKRRLYVHIIDTTDETGTGYDPQSAQTIHFKRPKIHLSFSCLNKKTSHSLLVK
jgi:hypothetical protein